MSTFATLYDEQLEAGDEMALEQLRQEFDVRMQRLEDQVQKLTTSVEGYRGNQEQTLMILQRIVNRHDEQLNGFQDKPGIVVKLDRVERVVESRTWHIRALWLALLAALSKLLADAFHR